VNILTFGCKITTIYEQKDGSKQKKSTFWQKVTDCKSDEAKNLLSGTVAHGRFHFLIVEKTIKSFVVFYHFIDEMLHFTFFILV
jgi:hypothetical protein